MASAMTSYHAPGIRKVIARAQALASRAKSAMAKTEETVETGIRAIEVGAAAFACGVVEGKMGSIQVVGVPLPLAAAAILHGAGFFSSNRTQSHLHALGDGALAAWASTKGFEVGKAWAAKSGTTAATKGDALDEMDLAGMGR